MKLTIITVCYNSAATIADTIKSVAAQTFSSIEYIVVDGGSTDDTLNLVEQHGSVVTKLIRGPDRGIYDAMNKGIQVATGDVVGFLNSDDVFAHNDVVSRIAQAMLVPSIDACYGDLVYVAQNDTNKVVRYWKSREYRPGLFKKGWVPAHPTFYARRELYQKYGDFDLDMHLAADFDILLRFFELHKITSAYIPEVMVKMRLGGATNASLVNILRQNTEIARAFRKYGFKVGLTLFAFRLMSRISQFSRRHSSYE